MIFTEFLTNWVLNIFYIIIVSAPLILTIRALIISVKSIKVRIGA